MKTKFGTRALTIKLVSKSLKKVASLFIRNCKLCPLSDAIKFCAEYVAGVWAGFTLENSPVV